VSLESGHCDQEKWFLNNKIPGKKKENNYTRMPRLGPQDCWGSGAPAGGEGGPGSARAKPTQQDMVFGTNDAAAEFRIKVSSQMNLEYAVASERATG